MTAADRNAWVAAGFNESSRNQARLARKKTVARRIKSWRPNSMSRRVIPPRTARPILSGSP
jgi:hypothetical protein